MTEPPLHNSEPSATRWSLIEAVAAGDPQAIDRFVRRYQPELRLVLLRRLRGDHDLADEILQEFLCRKLLEQNFVTRVERGSEFRKFLVTVLINFMKDELQKRGRTQARQTNLQPEQAELLPSDIQDCDADLLELAWADRILREALQRMRNECVEKQQTPLWHVFEARMLRPSRDGVTAPSFQELQRQLGFRSPAEVGNLLETAKRKLRRHLQLVVAREAGSGNEASTESAFESELLDLHSALAQAKHRRITTAELSGSEWDNDESLLSQADAPERLRRILVLTHLNSPLWLPDESSAILRAELNCSIETTCDDEDFQRQLELHRAEPSRPTTLAQLFQMNAPPLWLLECVKTWSKHLLRDDETPLPKEVSYVLHYAALCAAIRAGHRSITRLSDADILQSVNLLLTYDWIDAALKTLFDETRNRLAGRSQPRLS